MTPFNRLYLIGRIVRGPKRLLGVEAGVDFTLEVSRDGSDALRIGERLVMLGSRQGQGNQVDRGDRSEPSTSGAGAPAESSGGPPADDDIPF